MLWNFTPGSDRPSSGWNESTLFCLWLHEGEELQSGADTMTPPSLPEDEKLPLLSILDFVPGEVTKINKVAVWEE